MQWTPETVIARADNTPAVAKVAQCAECGSRLFVVFVIGPRELLHYQCGICQVTFCDGHSCLEEP